MASAFREFSKYLSLVKFAHTVFALPFALIGFFLALKTSIPDTWLMQLLLVLLCMVFARNTAMAFNRYIDRNIDKLNPRTQKREIPAKILSPAAVLIFVIFNAAGFITATWFINLLCFYLSPVALLVVVGYSFTKRFTFLCHFILGLGLALAPIGAYIAVTGEFAVVPILLSFSVLLWVTGFDIIYALQDIDFDKANHLRSVPVVIGIKNALILSALLHVFSAAIIITIGIVSKFGMIYWAGTSVFLALLFYQHFIVKPKDLSRINLAFFTLNGIASVVFGIFTIAEITKEFFFF